ERGPEAVLLEQRAGDGEVRLAGVIEGQHHQLVRDRLPGERGSGPETQEDGAQEKGFHVVPPTRTGLTQTPTHRSMIVTTFSREGSGPRRRGPRVDGISE